MKYLDNEIEVLELLDKYEGREILADYLRNEAPLTEINELVEILNNALFYRKNKEK